MIDVSEEMIESARAATSIPAAGPGEAGRTTVVVWKKPG